jgi:hypothetical protein
MTILYGPDTPGARAKRRGNRAKKPPTLPETAYTAGMTGALTKFFTPYRDPASGIVSWVLSERIAPLQQAFYFVNTGFSPSQRYLWFYAAYPPAGGVNFGKVLAVIDFALGTLNVYPETQFRSESPLVTDEGVYWTSTKHLCFRGPAPGDKTVLLAKYPDELFGERHVALMSTHLTFSPDKRELFFDAAVGGAFFAGSYSLDRGEFAVWKRFDRHYNHGQFCPADGDLALIAQENWTDPATGTKTRYDNRLWLLRRDGSFAPVFKEDVRVTHEWWDRDGEHFYALDQSDRLGGPAILRFDRRDLSYVPWVPGKFWHANDFGSGKWFVADRHPWTDFYRNCPSQVIFIDRESDRRAVVVSKNPEIDTAGNVYHIDPHPRFSPDGSMFTHTTTLLGRADLALTFTADALAAL